MVVLIVLATLAIVLFSARVSRKKLGWERILLIALVIAAVPVLPSLLPVFALLAALTLPFIIVGAIVLAAGRAMIETWRRPKKVEVLGCGDHGGPHQKRIGAVELQWMIEDADNVIQLHPKAEEEEQHQLQCPDASHD